MIAPVYNDFLTLGIQATVQSGATVMLGESCELWRRRDPSKVAPSSCSPDHFMATRASGIPPRDHDVMNSRLSIEVPYSLQNNKNHYSTGKSFQLWGYIG